MSAAANGPVHQCRVVGGEKLADVSALRQSICEQVARAIAAEAPKAQYSVEIRIISPSRLTASLVVEGHPLPVQNFAVMDGNLSQITIGHFASSLASVVAEAAK